MGQKKRPGVRAAPSAASLGVSTRSGLERGKSTQSGMSGKSTHGLGRGMSTRSGMSGGKSLRSSASVDEDETLASASTRPGLGGTAGKSVRSLLKSANSVSSGLGLNSSSGHKISYKQKKARPGLAVMPQGMSTENLMRSKRDFNRSNSGLSAGSGHRDLNPRAGNKTSSPANSQHTLKKQMSLRSLDSGKSSRSLNSAKSKRSLTNSKSSRSVRSGGTSPAMPASKSSFRRAAPQPPPVTDEDGYYSGEEEYEEDMEQHDDYDDQDEEHATIVMPQTEEEIRQGLHTEQVTKGFFRKKVRSIKWYSADIDKVDAGKYEPGEGAIKEEEGSEYETDSDDSEEQVVPDPWYIALGRGLLLMEKKGEENTPIKRWLRFLTLLTFACDATAAIVVLVQYDEVQTCCGKPILNMGNINVNWSLIIRYATVFYLLLILAEVYPVLRRGFPFNIVNPIIGFVISFALFFDDSYKQALIMWVIETVAVLSEFICYRVKIRQVNMRAVEIKQLMPKTTKKKESFEDEDDYLKDLHKARRRYYVLKQEQRMDLRWLNYLHVAVYLNLIMSSVILMLILVIARNGGLCIVDFDYPNPFSSDQLARCDRCSDPDEMCQYCNNETESYQCYLPYH